MKVISSKEYSNQGIELNEVDFETRTIVTDILLDIYKNGDSAVRKYTSKFDKADLDSFKVTPEEIKESYTLIDDKLIDIIKKASDNVFFYHKKQKIDEFSYNTTNNSLIGQKVTPIERVALYVPGGKANYPSSVLMNAIPAIVAGVKEIVLITPVGKDGKINPAVLVAADLLNVTEIYKLGGAQAVAAVAYGTESIKKVDKVVGPGNKYVAEAKRQVFGLVDIDMIAGPSEILVIANENANPKFIARDLLSQAEHDENAKCYLLTTSDTIIEETKKYVTQFVSESSRKSILEKSVEHFLMIKSDSLEEMITLSNDIAPEHLEVLIENPESILDKLTNAGSIFLGEYSPEPVGDYFAGPNHTLPTSQTAKFSSPLSVYDFLKRSSFIKYSKADLMEHGKDIAYFADAEDLGEHANSIRERLKNESNLS